MFTLNKTSRFKLPDSNRLVTKRQGYRTSWGFQTSSFTFFIKSTGKKFNFERCTSVILDVLNPGHFESRHVESRHFKPGRFEYVYFYFHFFPVPYSTLLHLPPLRFNCFGGCWGTNPGQQWLWHWLSDALTTRLKQTNGAMLVRPRPMCPRPKILGCCIAWTKFSLAILPLTKPSHPQILIF